MGLRFLLATFGVMASGSGASSAATDRPNIVYLLADDLGCGDVGCLNPERGRIATPHLDRLAGQGMVFTDAHSSSSVCTPTRYGLLTGRYAWRTRLQSGVLDGVSDPPLIDADRLTLPALLRQHGYTTAAMGKWHLGFESDAVAKSDTYGEAGLPVGARIAGGPTSRGFDYFWGCSNARTISSLIENDRVVAAVPPVDMLPRLTRRAIDFIAAQAAAPSRRPFFLYVALTSPHSPVVPAPEWQGRSALGPYGDFVMQTDDSVGRILQALEAAGLASSTLVVFTSDNGHAHLRGVRDLEKVGHFASARFRGYKTDIWEGGHRVPFIVRWPGVVRPASRSDALVCLNDFMALTAEILGVRLPEAAAPDSVSFLSALQATSSPGGRTAVVHHSQEGRFAIRRGQWKLCLNPGSGGMGAPTDEEALRQALPEAQLYDLAADPGETTNLVSTHPAEARALARLLETDVARGRSTAGRAQANDVPVVLPVPDFLRRTEARPAPR